MYTIDNKGEAIKTVQRYLGLSENGIYDDKTRTAVKEFQSLNDLVTTGEVDFVSFSKLRTHYFDRERAKSARRLLPGARFPLQPGDGGSQVDALNSELAAALKKYSFYGIFPRGYYYNAYTSEAVIRLREIFGLEIKDIVDEELYMRVLRERLTRHSYRE
jgi:peptidoglycan hydrolase-like protein with peptidoglycan-binding domain